MSLPEDEQPRFVWVSTKESVGEDIPSALAILEVIAAVLAYWTTAVIFETTYPLWLSVCIAPLLLMRSEPSVKLGARWFHEYWESATTKLPNDLKLTSQKEFWIAASVTTIYSVIASYALCYYGLQNSDSVRLFWHAFFAALLAIAFSLTAVVATLPMKVRIGAAVSYIVPSLVAIVFLTLSGVVAFAAVVSCTALFVLLVRLRLMAVVLAFTAGPGVWLRSLAIRFAATAHHPLEGFALIPANFRTSLFVVDLHHKVELVPGYEQRSFQSDGLLEVLRDAPNWPSKLVVLAGAAVLLLPAYAYRLSIKSTCWLYLPLIYIMSRRDTSFDVTHLIDRIRQSPWEFARRLLAIAVFASFLIATTIFNLSMESFRSPATVISPIEYLFVIDFQFWKKPWQIFSLVSAVITWFLFFQSKDILVDLQHAHSERSKAAVDERYQGLKILMRVRNFSSAGLVLLLAVHAVLILSPITKHLPPYFLRGLTWVYGDYMPHSL